MFEDPLPFNCTVRVYTENYAPAMQHYQKKEPLPKNNSANNLRNKQKTSSNSIKRSTSLIVGQKLRESKWFAHDELKVLCAVTESGFILERQSDPKNIFGIGLWTPGFEKSKNPDHMKVYSVSLSNKRHTKVYSCNLLEFWPQGTKIKINNYSDKDMSPHNEEIIRDQIAYAQNNKKQWHNARHFTYWCRYGEPQVNYRVKQVSDTVKWGNLGINIGLLLLKNKKRSPKNKSE